jgi:hypothetical protein
MLGSIIYLDTHRWNEGGVEGANVTPPPPKYEKINIFVYLHVCISNFSSKILVYLLVYSCNMFSMGENSTATCWSVCFTYTQLSSLYQLLELFWLLGYHLLVAWLYIACTGNCFHPSCEFFTHLWRHHHCP